MLIRSVLFNFQGAFLNSVFLISQTTLLLYHIFSSLSRGFSNFFQSFFQTILVLSKEVTSFSKAFILYHIASRLSRGFQNFFKVFCDLFAFAVPSSRVLVYYITFTGKSQHFFSSFFKFFHTLPSVSPNPLLFIYIIYSREKRTVFAVRTNQNSILS